MFKRAVQLALIVGFFGAMVGLVALGERIPDRNGSGLEARLLAQKPVFRLKKLVSGQFNKDVETYLSDQFPYRDLWVKGYMKFNLRGLGKVAMNDAVVGRERQILWDQSKHEPMSDAEIDRQLAVSMKQFKTLDRLVSSYGGTFVYVGHPTLASFLRERYPVGFEFPADFDRTGDKLFAALDEAGIENVNMRPVLEKHRDEKLYFRTDHHFTLKGGYYVYREIVNKTGQKPLVWGQDWQVTTLGPPFLGSMNRKLGLAMPMDEDTDIIELKKPIEYTKTTDGRPDPRIMYLPKAGKPNSYKIYMYGDHSEVIVDTNRPELPTLMLFGDSFTNAVEPMLWTNYDKTIILDFRYNKGSVYDYVKKYKPDYLVTVVRDELYLWRQGNGRFDGKDAGGGASE